MTMNHDQLQSFARLIQSGQKIEAIKLLRTTLGLGLKEGKDLVETFPQATPNLTVTQMDQVAGLVGQDYYMAYDRICYTICPSANLDQVEEWALKFSGRKTPQAPEHLVFTREAGDADNQWKRYYNFDDRAEAVSFANREIVECENREVVVVQVVAKTVQTLKEVA